jgi:hypothetical protein
MDRMVRLDGSEPRNPRNLRIKIHLVAMFTPQKRSFVGIDLSPEIWGSMEISWLIPQCIASRRTGVGCGAFSIYSLSAPAKV